MNQKTRKKLLLGLVCGAVLFGCTKGSESGTFTPEQGVKNPNPPSTTTPSDGPFVHPGILNTGASLDYIASDYSATRVAAFQKVEDCIKNLAYPTRFYEEVVVGSNGNTTESKSQIRRDAELAYAYALRFARTANIQDAEKCIFILNGWASTFKRYAIKSSTDNANQPSLETAWTTPTFVAAAEIIRHYRPKGKSAEWAEEDIKKFNNFLNISKSYIDKMPYYRNNWNTSGGYALMAIGIFQNNTSTYAQGIAAINRVINDTDPNAAILKDGTMTELCGRNDCHHFQYTLTALTFAAELAALNGDNTLYTNFRVSLGYDFMKKAYNRETSCKICSTDSYNPDKVWPGLEVALRRFGASKAPNIQWIKDRIQGPLYITNDHTFLGFTTYTHYNVSE